MEKKLVLLHSNDIHGDLLPTTVNGKSIGGIAALSGFVRNEKRGR